MGRVRAAVTVAVACMLLVLGMQSLWLYRGTGVLSQLDLRRGTGLFLEEDGRLLRSVNDTALEGLPSKDAATAAVRRAWGDGDSVADGASAAASGGDGGSVQDPAPRIIDVVAAGSEWPSLLEADVAAMVLGPRPDDMPRPAILLFCYNRPEYLRQTLGSLASLDGLSQFAVYISQVG